MSNLDVDEKQIHLWTTAHHEITDKDVLKKYHDLLNTVEKAKGCEFVSIIRSVLL